MELELSPEGRVGLPRRPVTGGDEVLRGQGLHPHAAAARAFVLGQWPQVHRISGYAERSVAGTLTPSKHALGRAIDVMIPDWSSPRGIALGDAIADWFVA